jgi:hypothetical protein
MTHSLLACICNSQTTLLFTSHTHLCRFILTPPCILLLGMHHSETFSHRACMSAILDISFDTDRPLFEGFVQPLSDYPLNFRSPSPARPVHFFKPFISEPILSCLCCLLVALLCGVTDQQICCSLLKNKLLIQQKPVHDEFLAGAVMLSPQCFTMCGFLFTEPSLVLFAKLRSTNVSVASSPICTSLLSMQSFQWPSPTAALQKNCGRRCSTTWDCPIVALCFDATTSRISCQRKLDADLNLKSCQ